MNKYDQLKYGIRRQGDVLLIPIDAIPINAEKKLNGIVAYGETTGHSHQFLDCQMAQVYSFGSNQYVDIIQPTILYHEEHKPQTIPIGKYQILIKRELDEVGEIRKVMD